jgi:hypothetical protein
LTIALSANRQLGCHVTEAKLQKWAFSLAYDGNQPTVQR